MLLLVLIPVLVAGFFLLAVGVYALFRLQSDGAAETKIGWGKLSVTTRNEAIAVLTLGVILFLAALGGVIATSGDDDDEAASSTTAPPPPPPTTTAPTTMTALAPTTTLPPTTRPPPTTTTATPPTTTPPTTTTTTVVQVEIPRDLEYAVLASKLQELGLPFSATWVPSIQVPAGTLIRIDPPGGRMVDPDTVVSLTVSTGSASEVYRTITTRGTYIVGLGSQAGLSVDEAGNPAGPSIDALHEAMYRLFGDTVDFEYTQPTAAERYEIIQTGSVDILLNGFTRLPGEITNVEEILFAVEGETQVIVVLSPGFKAELEPNLLQAVIDLGL